MLYIIPDKKRLYKGLVSVRDYIVRGCIQRRETLKIQYRGRIQTLDTVEKLRSYKNYGPRIFLSKIDGRLYRLIDYKWIPDREPLKVDKQLNLF